MRESDEIVLIEDDEDKAEVIISILKRHLSGTIRHFYDGEAAIDFIFSEASRNTSLILLDLILPRIDGVEILRRIKSDSSKNNIPVIILTSSSQTQHYLDSLGLQPDGYVSKPSALRNCA
jgi:two-component system, response regulator